MESPEHMPEKEDLNPERMDSIMRRTGEQLHEIFREGDRLADKERSHLYDLLEIDYPVSKEAAKEAYIEVWDANGRLADSASKPQLEEALKLLDAAVAIHNYPAYRKVQQTVVRRLEKMKGKTDKSHAA